MASDFPPSTNPPLAAPQDPVPGSFSAEFDDALNTSSGLAGIPGIVTSLELVILGRVFSTDHADTIATFEDGVFHGVRVNGPAGRAARDDPEHR